MLLLLSPFSPHVWDLSRFGAKTQKKVFHLLGPRPLYYLQIWFIWSSSYHSVENLKNRFIRSPFLPSFAPRQCVSVWASLASFFHTLISVSYRLMNCLISGTNASCKKKRKRGERERERLGAWTGHDNELISKRGWDKVLRAAVMVVTYVYVKTDSNPATLQCIHFCSLQGMMPQLSGDRRNCVHF